MLVTRNQIADLIATMRMASSLARSLGMEMAMDVHDAPEALVEKIAEWFDSEVESFDEHEHFITTEAEGVTFYS